MADRSEKGSPVQATDPTRAAGIILRGYHPGDSKAMHALDVLCFANPFRFSQREMRRLAEQRGAISLVAMAAAELAGFCIAHRDRNWGYLVTLDVAPGWRRKGLAARLLQEAEAELRATGAVGMGLHVHTGNEGAIRFYERLGYERVGIADGFYGPELDGFIYRKTW